MNNISLLICSLLFSSTLVPVTKGEFEQGSLPEKLITDKRNHKNGGLLKVANCKALKDNTAEDNFYTYEYIGSIGTHLKVIRKSMYNGESYLIIDPKNDCWIYYLLGKPFASDSLIVNFNESETTDRKNVIEIRRRGALDKVKQIVIKPDLTFVEVRFTPGGLLLKDMAGNYWKVAI